MVDRALFFRNSVLGPKFTAERPTISPISRFSGSRASLDYTSRWRAQHTKSPYHGDRNSCSTRLEIYTRGRRYGCTNIADIVTPYAKELGITFRPSIGIADVTTIRNLHSETVDRTLVSRNSVPGPKFAAERTVDRALVLRNSVPGPKFAAERVFSIPIVVPVGVGRGYLFARRSEPPARPHFRIGTSSRSAQGRIRTFPVWQPNSSPGAWSRAADAIAYGHPFAQTGITFRSVIRITCKTPTRNRHSEALVSPLSPQAMRRHFGVEKPSFRAPKLRF
ncbi:hypothetical protein Taro_010210, partial [Colocasia esculenta]|nr:hypothetical protein [Colocasia esculenta]